MYPELLEKLRSERFFEQKVGRDILLLFAVTEFEFAEAELLRLNERLNSGPLAKEFADWVRSWASDD